MDLGRAVATIGAFQKEVAEYTVSEQLQALSRALTQAAATPSATADEAFSATLKAFYTMLEGLPSNDWGPSRHRDLRALNIHDLVGHGLRQRIDTIVTANAVTRSIAAKELAELSTVFQTAVTNTAQIVEATKWLGIEPAKSNDDQCEVSLNLPGEGNNATLEALDKDLEGFNKLLRFLNEIAGESGISPAVIGLSTGSFHIDLSVTLEVAKTLLALISGIVALRKLVSDLRDTGKKLEAQPDIPREVIVQINLAADARIEDGLRKLADDTAHQGSHLDNNRANELANGLSVSVRFLARKIDEGVRVDVDFPAQLPQGTTVGKTEEQIESLTRSRSSIRVALPCGSSGRTLAYNLATDHFDHGSCNTQIPECRAVAQDNGSVTAGMPHPANAHEPKGQVHFDVRNLTLKRDVNTKVQLPPARAKELANEFLSL